MVYMSFEAMLALASEADDELLYSPDGDVLEVDSCGLDWIDRCVMCSTDVSRYDDEHPGRTNGYRPPFSVKPFIEMLLQ